MSEMQSMVIFACCIFFCVLSIILLIHNPIQNPSLYKINLFNQAAICKILCKTILVFLDFCIQVKCLSTNCLCFASNLYLLLISVKDQHRSLLQLAISKAAESSNIFLLISKSKSTPTIWLLIVSFKFSGQIAFHVLESVVYFF